MRLFFVRRKQTRLQNAPKTPDPYWQYIVDLPHRRKREYFCCRQKQENPPWSLPQAPQLYVGKLNNTHAKVRHGHWSVWVIQDTYSITPWKSSCVIGLIVNRREYRTHGMKPSATERGDGIHLLCPLRSCYDEPAWEIIQIRQWKSPWYQQYENWSYIWTEDLPQTER